MKVLGMAALVCAKRKVLPRDVYSTSLDDLKDLMKKDADKTNVCPDT